MLAGGPIRVRMGHTGEPRPTGKGYVGRDVHKGARIAPIGHRDQVLLSSTTRALVGAGVRDHGPAFATTPEGPSLEEVIGRPTAVQQRMPIRPDRSMREMKMPASREWVAVRSLRGLP